MCKLFISQCLCALTDRWEHLFDEGQTDICTTFFSPHVLLLLLYEQSEIEAPP